MIEFVKWCFSDMFHGFITICILGGVGEWSIEFAKALRRK